MERYKIRTYKLAFLFVLLLIYPLAGKSDDMKTKSNKLTQPGLVLTFDDHSVADWVKAMPIFKKYGAHVTFFIDRWDKLSSDQVAGLKKLENAGHAIGCHSLRHYPATTYIKEHSLEQYMAAEIIPAVKLMKKDGFNPVCFAYPCSARNSKTDEALLKIFRHLRGGVGHNKSLEQINSIFIDLDKVKDSGCLIGTCFQPHSLQDPIIAEAEKAFMRAKKNNEIIVFYAHDIRPDNTPGPSNYIVPDALERVLELAKSQGLKFYTFAELP